MQVPSWPWFRRQSREFARTVTHDLERERKRSLPRGKVRSGFYLGYPNLPDRALLSTLLDSLPDFFRREGSVDVPDPQRG